MATSAAIGHSSVWAIYNGSTYVAVAEVTNWSFAYARDAVEATHMASPNGHREYVNGLQSFTASFEINFVPVVPDPILAAMQASNSQFKLTYPNGVNTVFFGKITAYDITGPLDDKMTASVSIQGTGEPTEAAS